MIDLNDPEMKDIIEEFVLESRLIVTQLQEILERLEENPKDGSELKQFAQVIDSMVGAAETLGVNQIEHLCKKGKSVSQKAGQHNESTLNETTCGVLFDLVDHIENLLNNLLEKSQEEYNLDSFMTRLDWLAEKFSHIKLDKKVIEDKKNVKKESASKATAELQKLIGKK